MTFVDVLAHPCILRCRAAGNRPIEIETAVEEWRKQVLPEIEGQLLKQAQSEFSAGEKTS